MKSLLPSVGKISTAKQIIVFALLGAILIIAQVALAFIPNVELVSLLIIAYTRILKAKALYPIAVFILVEGVIYGFGLWWINYLYIWAVLVMVTMLFHKLEARLLWALISGLFGLLYGALCAIPYLFIGGVSSAIAYWISGIPFDLAHCAGNFIAVLLLLSPTHNILRRSLKEFV